jgi:hypothetical protein
LLLQILTQAPIDTTRGCLPACLKVLEKRVAELVFPVQRHVGVGREDFSR